MKRRILLICVLVLVVLAAGFTVFAVWYHKPVERSVTMTACTTDGETAELELNLIFYRNFLKPTFIGGTIRCDGVTYVDFVQKYDGVGGNLEFSDNLWKNLYYKQRCGGFHYREFFNKDTPWDKKMMDINYWKDYIYIFAHTGGLDPESFVLQHTTTPKIDGEEVEVSKLYYAPATTAEEAEALQEMFGAILQEWYGGAES